jgi:D-tyrosyl-tRNA(Tyr) deacylase
MLRERGVPTQMGVFGARMEVALVNDGPVTIVLEIRNQELGD